MGNKQLNKVLSYVLLVCICIPTAALPGWCTRILELVRLVAFAWSIIIFCISKVYQQKRLWPLWSLLLIALCSTLINNTNLIKCFEFVVTVFAGSVITFYLIRLYKAKAVNMIAVLFSVLMIIQGLTALIGGLGYRVDGNGISNLFYFFGQRVAISNILIYAIGLAMLALKTSGKPESWVHILALVCCVYFSLYESISTAIVSISVFTIVFVGAKVVRSERVWRNALIALLAFSAIFVFSGGLTNGFEWLLEDLLGEGITLNGRTLLWVQAISKIKSWHWVVGNGYGHSYIFSLGDYYNAWNVDTAHSQYMNVLFDFGIVGIISYFIMCYQQILPVRKIKDGGVRGILLATILSIIITGIPTTMYKQIYMYIHYVVIIYYDQIIDLNAIHKKELKQYRRRIRLR